MYIAHSCKKCSREFILLDEELNRIRNSKNEIYIVCPYCSSKSIKVTNKYSSIKECMDSERVYKRKNGKLQQIR